MNIFFIKMNSCIALSFLDRWSEGNMKYPPYLVLFVFLSDCPFIQSSPERLGFLHKIRVEPNFFWKKILFWGLWAKSYQNGPKMRFLGFTKNQCRIFFRFSAWSYSNMLRVRLNDFFRKKLFLTYSGQKGQKWAQNEVF